MVDEDRTSGEKDLVDRCCRGDESAWSEFLRDYGSIVCRTARVGLLRCGVRDSAEAEDVTAEVFRALVQDNCRLLRVYDPRYHLSTWLCTIAQKEALHWMRKRHGVEKFPEAQFQLQRWKESAGEMALPETAAEQKELGEMVHKAVGQLPSRERMVLRAFYFEGADSSVLSRMLGIPVSQVGKVVQRAREKVAEILKKT